MSLGNVLVTGGAGFIGSHLVDKLVERGYNVRVLDNLSSGTEENLAKSRNKIKFIKADIRDYETLERACSGCETICHLAAMISVPESLDNPHECYEINVLATLKILDFAAKNNSRVIFASSAAVYGDDSTPIKTEELETIPLSPYGLSKLDVERLMEMYSKEKKLEYTCFRNFNVYGPRQDVSSAYAAVIPIFITRALKGEELVIFGDGEQTRDFIYVGDVVDAYIEAMKENISGVFNLGCNDILSVKKLSQRVLETTESSSLVKHREERKGDIKHSRASSEKFKKISSWEPRVSLNEGIEKTVKYYEKHI